MVDSSREAFERFAEKREFDLTPNTTVFADELPYADIETQNHFDTWKASRSAAIEECAEACKLVAVACEDVYDGMQQIEQAAREAANECAAAILALKGEG